MPSINMIAPRRAELKRLEQGVRRLLLVILVEILAVICLTAYLSTRYVNTKSEIASLEAELSKLEPIVKKIEAYDKASAELQPKVQLLNDAKDHTMRWFRVLETLTVSIPRETWLTRIAASPPQQDSNVVIVNLNGISTSQDLIGETMMRLNSYKGFESVDLHFTQKGMVGQKQVIEFEVGAGLKLGEKKGAQKDNGTSSS